MCAFFSKVNEAPPIVPNTGGYKPTFLHKVESEDVSNDFLDGEDLRKGSPFKVGELPLESFVVLAPWHRRSYESTFSDKVLWADEYGNMMGARSVKGGTFNDGSSPRLVYDPSCGWKFWKLFQLKYLDRTNKTSQLMRENHLPTERIIRAEEINEVIIDGEEVPLSELRRKEERKMKLLNMPFTNKKREALEAINDSVGRIEREVPVAERVTDIASFARLPEEVMLIEGEDVFFRNGKFTRDTFSDHLEKWESQVTEDKVKEFIEENHGFKPTQFHIDQEVEKRKRIIDELKGYCLDKDTEGIVSTGYSFRKSMEKVINWVNVANEQSGREVEKFDPNSEEDIRRYLSSYLPSEMGDYLSRFHNLGLAHMFATPHNWSMNGNLYDLDSVIGLPLGDEPNSTENINRDIEGTIKTIVGMYGIRAIADQDTSKRDPASFTMRKAVENPLTGKLIRGPRNEYVYSGYLSQLYGEKGIVDMARQSVVNFLINYYKGIDVDMSDEEKYHSMLSHLDILGEKPKARIVEIIEKELNE